MISIILIDDHKLILEGVAQMLSAEEDIHIAAEFTSPRAALDYIRQHEIDIVITDLDMPEMNGIHVIKAIRKIKTKQKIIVLSMIDENSIINRMVKYDVNGYLMKNEAQGELASAIRKVAEGGIFYNKDIRQKLFVNPSETKETSSASIPRLSKREKEILRLVVDEHTAKEIAALLFISEGTVITHRKHVIAKLGAKNTAGMVRIALELGLV